MAIEGTATPTLHPPFEEISCDTFRGTNVSIHDSRRFICSTLSSVYAERADHHKPIDAGTAQPDLVPRFEFSQDHICLTVIIVSIKIQLVFVCQLLHMHTYYGSHSRIYSSNFNSYRPCPLSFPNAQYFSGFRYPFPHTTYSHLRHARLRVAPFMPPSRKRAIHTHRLPTRRHKTASLSCRVLGAHAWEHVLSCAQADKEREWHEPNVQPKEGGDLGEGWHLRLLVVVVPPRST